MLSLEIIARVNVNVSRSSALPTAFDTGLLLVKDASFAEAKRLRSYASSAEAAAGLIADGFPASSEAYKAAQKYFAASPAPPRLLVSCHPASESPVQALDAALQKTRDFYGIALADPVTDGEALALDTHLSGLEKPAVWFAALTGTPAAAAASGSLLERLHAAGSRRTVATYVSAVSDAAAVMGAAMGLEAAHAASAFALCYKRVGGLQPSDLTEAQAEAIEELGGNVYVTRGARHTLLEKGSTPSLLRYDEVLYLDQIAEDLQNAALSLLADNPDRLPQTDDASAQFMNAFTGVLIRYTGRGILASAPWRGAALGSLSPGDWLENGFALWADSYDNQPEADRAAHKAMPIQAALTLAGSLESVVINVNVKL
ncbi:MAG: DUF3383 family protein [Clostridia bacterium]|nr:DUF3383 family protein [Clostridia bacterium]